MTRRNQVIAGLCALAAICLWGAHRAGVFRSPTANSKTNVAAVQAASVPAAAATTSMVAPAIEVGRVPLSIPGLDDSDPMTFVALQYDKTHVVFRLGDDAQFGLEDPENQEKMLHPLAQAAAEYGSYSPQEIEPGLLESLKKYWAAAQVGDRWQLELSPGARIPVTIQKPVGMTWDCSPNSYVAGFIAEVPQEFQAAFAQGPQKYFLVHKSGPPRADALKLPHVGEMKDWTPTPEVRTQMEQVAMDQLRTEIAKGFAKRWQRRADRGKLDEQEQAEYDSAKNFSDLTAAGKGKLSYDFQAFQLAPDGLPRVFVRARWMSDGDASQAFLKDMWLRIGPTVSLEHNDQDGTRNMWMVRGVEGTESFELSYLPTVVNVFDKSDGYADVLIYSPGYEGYSITLYRYTAAGLSPTTILNSDGC